MRRFIKIVAGINTVFAYLFAFIFSILFDSSGSTIRLVEKPANRRRTCQNQ
ncbi:hypothetical protein [Bacillus sp. 1P06AnD]|uniref:hypothetical protein n=1 Tax=Bacillus sp. 1P06AnD TaxID=3132208 RepID=UPI0039A38421